MSSEKILAIGTEVITPEGNHGIIDIVYQLSPAYEILLHNGKRETWNRCVIKPIKKFNVGDEVWVKGYMVCPSNDCDDDLIIQIPASGNKKFHRSIHIDSVFCKQDIPK